MKNWCQVLSVVLTIVGALGIVGLIFGYAMKDSGIATASAFVAVLVVPGAVLGALAKHLELQQMILTELMRLK